MNLKLLIFFLLTGTVLFSQTDFRYKRSLGLVSKGWKSIAVPDDLFQHIQSDFSDLRIMGIRGKDSSEVPYIVRSESTTIQDESTSFQIINQTTTDAGSFFTIEIPKEQVINQLDFDFEETNYDWNIRLEGSEDQLSWYTVADHYRLTAISNEHIQFNYNSISFPAAKFRYFRLFVPEKPVHLNQVYLSSGNEFDLQKIHAVSIEKMHIIHDKHSKQTIIDVQLTYPVPVNFIQIKPENDYEYLRDVSIEYAYDTLHDESSTEVLYQKIGSGILKSGTENKLFCDQLVVQHLRIRIRNADNEPLTISTVRIYSNTYQLAARFPETGTYQLFYGNPGLQAPEYDIQLFTDQIPASLNSISPGKEFSISKTPIETPKTPGFNKTYLLWILISVISVLLIVLSLRMVKKNDEKQPD